MGCRARSPGLAANGHGCVPDTPNNESHDRSSPLPGAFRRARRNRSLGAEHAPRTSRLARRPLSRQRAREASPVAGATFMIGRASSGRAARLPRRRWVLLACLAAVLAVPGAAGSNRQNARDGEAASPSEVAEKQSDLKSLRSQIETLRKQMTAAEGSRKDALDQLQDAERAISSTQRELHQLASEIGKLQARLKESRHAIARTRTGSERAAGTPGKAALPPVPARQSRPAARVSER
jgi:vacuolar-type H+-ATPase subunit I/STV1